MSQLSYAADDQERAGSSTSGASGVAAGAASASSMVAGSVSVTPPPPESARERRAQPASRAVELVDDELGPSLTSAQLMRAPGAERLLPDLSVSNEALLASLRPAAENTLGTRVSRVARSQGERALYWFGTRPSWLQATLSVAGGSLVGLSLVVAYARAFHAPTEAEIAAEPSGAARTVALAAAAAPAALLAQSVVQPLAAAPAPAKAAAPAQPAPEAAAAAEPAAAPEQQPDTGADDEEQREPRRHGKRQRASQASSGKLPAWVQQQVKPQVQRATARERKAALREKRAAALREKKARRSRAKAREQQ